MNSTEKIKELRKLLKVSRARVAEVTEDFLGTEHLAHVLRESRLQVIKWAVVAQVISLTVILLLIENI